MKKIFFFGSILMFAVSCGEAKKPAMHDHDHKAAGPAKATTVQLASGKDLVCGMQVEASTADTTAVNGLVYGFCSAECKQSFLSDTATYLHQ